MFTVVGWLVGWSVGWYKGAVVHGRCCLSSSFLLLLLGVFFATVGRRPFAVQWTKVGWNCTILIPDQPSLCPSLCHIARCKNRSLDNKSISNVDTSINGKIDCSRYRSSTSAPTVPQTGTRVASPLHLSACISSCF